MDVNLKYGLGLLAVLVVIAGIAWCGRNRRRLKKYRASWEQRSTMIRLKRDRNMLASDPDLQTRPPAPGDKPAEGGRRRE
jgi:hypothetical protein